MKTSIHIIILLLSIGLSLLYANEIEYNTDRPGSDYKQLGNLKNSSVCQKKCQIENRCLAWTFVKANTIQGPKSHCYLKDKIPNNVYNASTISGVINRRVVQENSNIPTTDEIKRYIAQYGNDIFFKKENAISLFGQVHWAALNELIGIRAGEKISAASLRDKECTDINKLEQCRLKKIVNMIKENKKLKLYISIKKKIGGVANARVESMKEYLAWYGLIPGSEYHVKKVSRKDKKRSDWLSKNSHLWIRVEQIRN